MKIVVDMQGCQTSSRFRGIGRYTTAFVQGLLKNKQDHDIYLLCNARLNDCLEEINKIFSTLLPKRNIIYFNFEGNVAEIDVNNIDNTICSEKAREVYLAEIDPDLVILTSLFEGFVDDAVTSIAMHSNPTYKTAVILYDLIPYLNPDPNWPDHYKGYYYRKIDSFKKADLYLSISEYSKQEALSVFPDIESKTVNISSACDLKFEPSIYDEGICKSILSKFGIYKRYIMSSGTIEPRKNFKVIIRALALLPKELKDQTQFVVVGAGEKQYENEMREIAENLGISSSLVLTGHIDDDELVLLYNKSELFIFASLHEGFGLPPLEAMSCGVPTIASNTTSLPEVIGSNAALIEPNNPQNIANKIVEVLTNQLFKSGLAEHALLQSKKFSWDITAQKALLAVEGLSKKNDSNKTLTESKPVLAYISPLPPEHTGIADYSADLLRELSPYYDIKVIVDQPIVSDDWILSNCKIHTPDWLRVHQEKIDRVIYHFGNSYFHSFMYSLLEDVPGLVVLHDFFLSNLFISLEEIYQQKDAWSKQLYQVHGYKAVSDRFHDFVYAKMNYPVSKSILERSSGVIVHSQYSKLLASQWYGKGCSDQWRVIPLLRKSVLSSNKARAKSLLGFNQDDFIVGSFGIVDPSKLNHVTLSAWMKSVLSRANNSKLVFVGQGFEGDYFNNLVDAARKSKFESNIHFTGRCEIDIYKLYLEAVDVAVQLRTTSRGETSAAVLDCMSYGIPTIVNANGSMAELDHSAVEMLPDAFDEGLLIQSLERLYIDLDLRASLGQKSKEVINTVNEPAHCAKLYFEAIESLKSNKIPTQKRILFDVTATVQNGLRTGIERVARSVIAEAIKIDSKAYRVEPVYLVCEYGRWFYKYARQFTLTLLNSPVGKLTDEVVELSREDLIIGLDITHTVIEADKSGFYNTLQNDGVRLFHILYDMLPITMPQVFPDWAESSHQQWLKVISKFDGVIGISKTVADEFQQWINDRDITHNKNLAVLWNHLGADIKASSPSFGLPTESERVLGVMAHSLTFLMVGTIEPRKGYLQTIDAFSQLWNKGIEVNLVIVGNEGWKPLEDSERRTIPETIRAIKNHSQLNKRLFWLEGISDEYLERVYAASTCLIAASEGEGFGLPLIEAAQHELPIIARDIPVFREVAGTHAYYFSGLDSESLANAIIKWIRLHELKHEPKSTGMPWLTWEQSTNQLLFKLS